MRYLHGDSVEFSENYNFLATLRGFMVCGSRVFQLYGEMESLKNDLGNRTKYMDNLTSEFTELCGELIVNINKTAQSRMQLTPVANLVTRLVNVLTDAGEDAKAAREQNMRNLEARINDEISLKRAEITSAIELFLTREILPFSSSTFSMGVSRNAVALTANFEFRGGISASFDLDPNRAGRLAAPLRVQDFISDMNLKIGMKKKLLAREQKPVYELLDTYYVTGIETADGFCIVRLKKKLEFTTDNIVIEMRVSDGVFDALITFVDSDEHQAFEADESDYESLKQLWNSVTDTVVPILEHKRRLNRLRLDGEDVLDSDRVVNFVERLIDQFAPITTELALHSTNPNELSLKVDLDDERREEIYLRKRELVKPLLTLPEKYVSRFAVLEVFPTDLDVPGVVDVESSDDIIEE